jgi:hypothetical protein
MDLKKTIKPKVKKDSMMVSLMKKLDIDETYTKPIKYKFPKVKNQVFPKSGYNYEADLLELKTTKKGYNALLVVDDIYSNYLDFEPLKSKTAPDVLNAFLTIFKRGIVTEPKASIRTDNGGEFKSVVDKYMHDNDILHLWSLPDRHKMMGNVENLNRQIGRVLMTYLTNMTAKTGKEYTEWTDIIDFVRHELNAFKKHPKDIDMNTYTPKPLNIEEPPKYKLHDLVYRRIEKPVNENDDKLHDHRFRQGDVRYNLIEPRKIIRVLAYTSKNPWRYILSGIPNVSYAEAELLPAKEKEEKYKVRQIIDKMVKSKIVYYKVWWKKYLKADATWEAKDKLIEDGLIEYINQFEDKNKK